MKIRIALSAFFLTILWSFSAWAQCTTPVADPPATFPPRDEVWVDDTLPPASLYSGAWDTAQKASGTQSLVAGPGAGAHAIAFNPPYPLVFGMAESFVFYAYLDPCAPPSRIVFSWPDPSEGWPIGVVWGAPLSGFQTVGSLPTGGGWQRFEITARDLGLEYSELAAPTFTIYDGCAWIDRIAKAPMPCIAPPAAAPQVPSTDVVWIDDAAPAGATVSGAVWDTAQKATGTKSFTRAPWAGRNTMSFTNATATLPIATGDDVVFYALVNPCAPPTRITAEWVTTDGVTHGTAWGADGDFLHLGPLPASGVWTRIAFPAYYAGLEGKSIKSVTFSVFDGQVWFDHAGVASPACVARDSAAPAHPSNDVVLFDDSTPAGGMLTFDRMVWEDRRKASGTRSLTKPPYTGSANVWMTFAPTTFGANDALAFDLLVSDCAPTKRVVITLNEDQSTTGDPLNYSLVWGEPLTPEPRRPVINVGPLPAAGTWTRMVLPAHGLGFEGLVIDGATVEIEDGQAWFDRLAKSGVCATATAAAPSLPSTDFVWLDDQLPAGGALNGGAWDTTQKASGTRSLATGNVMNIYGPLSFLKGESIVFSVLVNECAPPSRLVFGYGIAPDQHYPEGALKAFVWGDPIDDPEYFVNVGPLPAPGVWTRITIPVQPLDLEYRTISAVQFEADGGQVWIDRIGKSASCSVTAAAAVSALPANARVWIDDATPAGATLGTGTFWDDTQRATGTKSFTRAPWRGANPVEIANATSTLSVNTNDWLFVHALINACDPVTWIEADWTATDGTVGKAAWGSMNLTGTLYAGTLPSPGTWARLDVPARYVGLEGKSIQSLKLIVNNGQAWFDAIGAYLPSCIPATAAAPTLNPNDVAIIDDDAPAGWTTTGALWESYQSASGTRSISAAPLPVTNRIASFLGNTSNAVSVGAADSFVFYVLTNPCNPPSAVSVAIRPTDPSESADPDVYHTIDVSLPTPGVWTRYTVLASSLSLAGRTINGIDVSIVGGQGWVDWIGLTH